MRSEPVINVSLPGRLVENAVDLFGDEGRAWLERLPDIISDCERAWSLVAGSPFENLSYNYIAPVVRADGTEAVLKIGVPNPELVSEVGALTFYDGRGIVRLLASDLDRGGLLLERLRPGTPLRDIDDEQAVRAAARLMKELWRPVPEEHPFTFTTVARWVQGFDRLRDRFDGGTGPLPETAVEKAEGLFAELHASTGGPVLLHGDFHQENILCAERRPWLAIDPKGVAGDPAYEIGPLLRNIEPRLLEDEPAEEIIARRVTILGDELGFDVYRLLGWGYVHMILSAWWSVEDHGAGWEWAVYCAEIIDRMMMSLI